MPLRYNQAIIDAIISHDLIKVKSLWENNYNKDVIQLHELVTNAALYGNLEIIKYLIECGVNFNVKLVRSALELAIINSSNDSLEIIKLLIKNGAAVNQAALFDKTPLYAAINSGKLEVVRLLIETKADVNLASLVDESPLCTAIKLKNLKMIELLLKNGANINTKIDGQVAIVYAVKNNNIKLAELLIKYGAKVNTVSSLDEPLIHTAMSYDRLDMIELLIKNGVGINSKIDSQELIIYAVKYNKLKVAELLINLGADVESASSDGDKLTNIAISYGHLEMLKLLVARGADIASNINNLVDGDAPIIFAVMNRQIELVKYILSHGADLNFNSHQYGVPPIALAAYAKNEKMLELLVDEGADVINALYYVEEASLSYLADTLEHIVRKKIEELRNYKETLGFNNYSEGVDVNFESILSNKAVDLIIAAVLCRRNIFDRLSGYSSGVVGDHDTVVVNKFLTLVKEKHITSKHQLPSFESSVKEIKELILQRINSEDSITDQKEQSNYNCEKQKAIKNFLSEYSSDAKFDNNLKEDFARVFLKNYDRFDQNHLAFEWINTINFNANLDVDELVKEIFMYAVACRDDLIKNGHSAEELDSVLILQISNLMQSNSDEMRSVGRDNKLIVKEGVPKKSCLAGTPRAFSELFSSYLSIMNGKGESLTHDEIQQASFSAINPILQNLLKKAPSAGLEIAYDENKVARTKKFLKHATDALATVGSDNIREILNNEVILGITSSIPIKKKHILIRNVAMLKTYPEYKDFENAVAANMQKKAENGVMFSEIDSAYLKLLYVSISDHTIRSKLYNTLTCELENLEMQVARVNIDGPETANIKRVLLDMSALQESKKYSKDTKVPTLALKNSLKIALKSSLSNYDEEIFDDAVIAPLDNITSNVDKYRVGLTALDVKQLLNQLKADFNIEVNRLSQSDRKRPGM